MTATAAAPPEAAPLSVAQEALWYLSLLAPQRISYNETVSIRKDGPLDVPALRSALNEVVRRHEAWRTTFDTVAGEPVQVVGSPPEFDLPVLDLSHLTPEEAERRAVRVIADRARIPYDLRHGPLLRPTLMRFPGAHHRLYLSLHHLIFDGVSIYRVVFPELVALYDAFCAGVPSPLPDPVSRYADFARWEQKWITEPRAERRLAYWREHLASLPPLPLPLDRPRAQAPRFRGGMIPLSVPRDQVERLREAGRGVGATLFQVLASAWAVLLHRYSGHEDVTFGTPADLRQRPEFERVVGYCLTPLVLRVRLGDDPTLQELMLRVRNELLDGLDHLVPFERVVREIDPGRSSSTNPVYQTMIVLEPPVVGADPSWSVHFMESDVGAAVGATKLDLELALDERPDGHISGRLVYDRDLFEASTATRMTTQWLHLLKAVSAQPHMAVSEIPILTPVEQRRQIVEWNATTRDAWRTATVHELVSARAGRQPAGTPAVSDGQRTLSFAELEAESDRRAGELVEAGVEAGSVVALCSEPAAGLIIDVLAVLKLGGAYLMLGPGCAGPELDLILAESGATTVIASSGAPPRPAARIPRGSPLGGERAAGAPAPAGPVSSEAVCCLQRNAGAGETPTYVAAQHAPVANVAASLATEMGLGPGETVLSLSSTFLRAHVLELWMALIAGARIVLAPAEIAGDGARLRRLIAAEEVTLLHASPTVWRGLIDTGLRGCRGLKALAGSASGPRDGGAAGGSLTRELADEILDRCRVLWHAYGTGATTGYCTLARVEKNGPITIGRPLANTRVYVLDSHDQPVPVGVTGNLVVSGTGVEGSRSYSPEPSPGLFLEDPFDPGIAYRTGERARWLSNGELELMP